MSKKFLFSVLLTVFLITLFIWLFSESFFVKNKVVSSDLVGPQVINQSLEGETEDRKAESGKVEQSNDSTVNKDSLPSSESYKGKLLLAELVVLLIYADSDFSEEKKIEIEKDINFIYGHIDDYDTYEFHPNHQRPSFLINGKLVEASKRISFSGEIYEPESIKYKFGSFVEIDGAQRLAVSKDVLDSYKSAFSLRDQHPDAFNEVKEFSQNTKAVVMPNQDSNILESFYFLGFSEQGLAEFKNQLSSAPAWLDKNYIGKYRNPSVLDVLPAKEIFSYVPQESLPDNALIVQIYPGSGVGVGFVGIYDEDRWKILMIPF